MSLIADVLGAIRRPAAPHADTPPPFPFTGQPGGFSWGNSKTEPTERQIDLTTVESTLYSVIDLLSGDAGGVMWDLYRGDRARDMSHPEGKDPLTERDHLAVKLWNQPNDFMSGEHLRTAVAWHTEAVGEGWVVCDYLAPGVPRSFWPVRPDRMKPRTDKDKFLTGYIYTGPGGEKIPLELSEVLRLTPRPHPLDPHRGLGPVPALMTPLTTSLTAQQWIDSFYRNDATPGGMIELGLDEVLDDDDYKTVMTRWNEQHRGVNRAHRVGMLEIGSFKPMAVDFKKLQVTEMRHLTRDQVLEAYQLNKFMLGASEDVNRAAALAANDTYARRVLHRRVKWWNAFANGAYLSCFGTTGKGVVWCPENVIPEDREAENAERASKATAAKTYADAGVPIEQWAEFLDLPFEAGESGASATEVAVLVQKLYLGVGELGQPNVLLSTQEGRRILETAGVELDPWEPEDVEPEPEPPVIVPAAPMPPMPEPPDDDEDPEDDDEE